MKGKKYTERARFSGIVTLKTATLSTIGTPFFTGVLYLKMVDLSYCD